MGMIDAIATEYEFESGLTRKTIERIPEDKLGWKPHDKSMTLGRLASHLAETQGWAKGTIDADEFDVGKDFTALDGKSKAEILKAFDAQAAEAKAALKSGVSDATLMKPWALKMQGQTVFSMPKVAVLRTWVLNHQIHHRGQLSVYLRMLGQPVPSIYGPSADEQG